MDQESSKLANLESPLLNPSSEKGSIGKQNNESLDASDNITAELTKQVFLAGPLIVFGFLQYSIQLVAVMFAGHLGELSLSSTSMATSFAGVIGFSLMRAMLVLVLMGIPIAFIWFFTGHIFTLWSRLGNFK